MLGIYQVKERNGKRREVVARAHSIADTAHLAAAVLGVSLAELCDEKLFFIEEVNFGESFLNAGSRGVIAIF